MRTSRPLSPLSRSIDYPPGNWKILLMEEIRLTTWDVQNLVNGINTTNGPTSSGDRRISSTVSQLWKEKEHHHLQVGGQLGFPGDMCSLPDAITPVDRWRSGPPPSRVRFGGFFVFGGYDEASGRAPSILSRWYAHRIHWTGIFTCIRGHYITYPNKALL